MDDKQTKDTLDKMETMRTSYNMGRQHAAEVASHLAPLMRNIDGEAALRQFAALMLRSVGVK